MAGLLAYPTSGGLPIPIGIGTVAGITEALNGLTAAGTAPDFLPVNQQVTGFPY